jgi:hypothetical protein
MSIKLALKHLIKKANPLVDFGPSLDPQAAPRAEYEKFFSVHGVPIAVINAAGGMVRIQSKKVYTVKEMRKIVKEYAEYYKHLEKTPAIKQDFLNFSLLRDDAVNIIFKEDQGSGKSPQFILHDFFHCFFEEEPSELTKLNTSMEQLFKPEDYYEALKKDYDLSALHELEIPPSAWLKAFSNAGVGSVYHAFASMIPKKYWHLGATLAGTATGNWFTSGSVSGTPEKAYPDALADLIPMFFDPSKTVELNLKLEPLYVLYLPSTEHVSISRKQIGSKMLQIYPRSGSSEINNLLQTSVKRVLDTLDDILKNNIGNVMVVQ